MKAKAVSITLKGRVQQVGFRYFVYRLAAELNVMGFVKNLPNGNVYIEAEADDHIIEVFVAHCQMGPPSSRVDDMKVNGIPFQGFTGFSIR